MGKMTSQAGESLLPLGCFVEPVAPPNPDCSGDIEILSLYNVTSGYKPSLYKVSSRVKLSSYNLTLEINLSYYTVTEHL